MFKNVQPSFFVIKIAGDLAEIIAEEIAPGAMLDIENVAIMSIEFQSDIHAMNALQPAIDKLKQPINGAMVITDAFNPLFLPTEISNLDDVLDMDTKTDMMRFTGMDGNPYVVRKVTVDVDGETLIDARVGVEQFELPNYSELMQARSSNNIN